MTTVKFKLPQDGELIVAANSVGGCWVEAFDENESIGDMKVWYSISPTEFNAANSPSQMSALFIRKNFDYLEEIQNGR